MPLIDSALPKALCDTEKGTTGSHFSILPTLCSSERFEMSTERPQLLDLFDERFAVERTLPSPQILDERLHSVVFIAAQGNPSCVRPLYKNHYGRQRHILYR